MRHQKARRKLGRTAAHRHALMRNLATSLFAHDRIRTTDAKAKELRRVADRLVTLGKRDTLHARRLAAKQIRDREVLRRLFDEVAPGYEERHGGYTRIVKLGRRQGDNAPMTLVELMPAGPPEPKKSAKPKPVAPTVAPSSRVPETKERFDVGPEQGGGDSSAGGDETGGPSTEGESAPASGEDEGSEESPKS